MSTPALWEAFKLYGNTLYANSNYEQAIQEYTRGIQHDAEQPVLFTNRALAHLKLGNHMQAMMDAESAVRLSSSNLKAYYVLGRCHSHCNSHDAAVKAFKRCLEMTSEHDPSKGLYNEVFRYYFSERKKQHDARRKSELHAMRTYLDECMATGAADVRDSVVEQMYGIVSSSPRLDRSRAKARSTSAFERCEDFVDRIPECFLCPISLEVMRDPVMIVGTKQAAAMCSQHSYERSEILRHFDTNGPTDPIGRFTYEPHPVVIPNLTLRNCIHTFLEAHPWLFED